MALIGVPNLRARFAVLAFRGRHCQRTYQYMASDRCCIACFPNYPAHKQVMFLGYPKNPHPCTQSTQSEPCPPISPSTSTTYTMATPTLLLQRIFNPLNKI
ncbi:hypothetical protein PoB_003577500 [Plakobranchus ocellatus]|uniref:Uncharacterized protein n=1 Tax=Plakobranchus ocellatus TaxID=259542 RepID=A0AAV4AQW8_9GAST|nr:hypothetical protein PoB_003577500 [Plakobranchus ocellatus]